MTNIHGIHLDIKQLENNQVFVEVKAIGTLTHHDYEKITPLLDEALLNVKEPVVNMYIDGTEFEGWELRAAWDDLKLGLQYGKTFNKVAIYGNQRWQEIMSKVGGWFTSGEVRYFEDPLEALNWLRNEDTGESEP
ncbi:hypothetical protein ABT56_13040 [Photobacterium aquae]|uniref:STAS/SEC14 domain-containing protein n=1 Tax=Photobacterium aquae TaxID=1195763 RepID=A0A0J1GZP9_9GAMM|nr:STAS/SEC14 domain-containing protein [Photobacterium aquae]KLV05116.1 hypothetical protein ABT56_13040 [Photobacterium aquae]